MQEAIPPPSNGQSSQSDPKLQAIQQQYRSKHYLLEASNFFQRLFFLFISPVISFGNKMPLEQWSIPELPSADYSQAQFANLNSHIKSYADNNGQEQSEGKKGWKIVKCLFKAYKKYFLVCLLCGAISTTVSMLLPNITKEIIAYVESGDRTVSKGVSIVVFILALKFIQNLAESHLFYEFALIGFNVSNSLSLAVFNKALKYPTLCSKKYPLSQLINFSQVDAQRMTSLGFTTSAVIFFPIQLGVGIYLMYSFIGISFMSGIGVILVMTFFIFINSKISAKANQQLLKFKDKRMKITTEIFNQIRFIKVSAWEKYFFRKLNRARNEELAKIKKVSLLGVISILFFWITTPLILSLTFLTYTLLGNQMTAEKAFTTIILFNILQFPLRSLPESISQLTQIWVSVKRIGNFLYETEMDTKYITHFINSKQSEPYAIEMVDGYFYWDLEEKKQQGSKTDLTKDRESRTKAKDTEEPMSLNESDLDIRKSLLSEASEIIDYGIETPHLKVLKNINLSIRPGEFVIILGDTGSGKSSLLYSLLGEAKANPRYQPHITINGSVAFVPQKPWIMSSTVEGNILMHDSKDEQRLKNAVKYSCLEPDLKVLADGLNTTIGEKGINLSGGQKARINLARALYADKDIYLLDDIISAVDVHVGNSIIRDTILDFLKNKTRLLVTHAIPFAKYADRVVIVRKGQIVQNGTYEEVKETSYFKEIEKLENKKAKESDKQNKEESDATKIEQLAKLKEAKLLLRKSSVNEEAGIPKTVTDKLVEELMLPEDRKKGEVSWDVYASYITLNGGWLFITSVILAMTCWLTLSTLSNIEIQRWCEDPQEGYTDLYLFMAFSISSAFFAFCRALILVFSGIKQGTVAHKKMIKGLLYTSIPKFYDRVPTGRILNRVSKDLRELDEAIGFSFGNTLVCFFGLVGNLVICTYASTPYIVLPVIAFIYICIRFKRYYMCAQRQCVRLENVSSSPIVSGFTQSINGLSTIRSYKASEVFLNKQCTIVNINKRNRICREAMESWFAQRLAWLSYLVNVSAISFCILSANSNPSMAGLLLAYAFTIDENVIGMIYSLATLETKMVSVERVTNFMSIEPETGYVQYTKKWWTKEEPVNNVIPQGKVQFDHLVLKYRPDLPDVLKKLSFVINPREKIGVVGRTGAGKSTITSSILRLIEPTDGRILIDDQNILDLNLRDLRSSITLIPQDPVLIEGTLRDNLDPRKEHPDTLLVETLKKCCLDSFLTDREGLETNVSDSGDNLSVGQKQLICICRAIVRKSKLILIDEATANIDVKADSTIQKVIRECFGVSTVITIAHRLKTIIESDRILVLENGKVVQFASPHELLSDPKGVFYEMYNKASNDDKL